MTTKYRVYNELSEDEKAQIATEKQWHKRGYCPVENEGELMYCNRSWSKAVYFRADQVRRMSETELALTVVNTRVFITPMTGDRGTQALAIGGVLVACLGTSAFIFFLVFKRRKEQEDK